MIIRTLSVTLPGNLTPGTYYVGAIADSNGQVSESGVGDASYDDVVPITIVALQDDNVGGDALQWMHSVMLAHKQSLSRRTR